MRRLIVALAASCLMLMAASAWAAVDDAYTTSLLHFNADFSDDGGSTWATGGSPELSTATTKFGASSLYLNGSSYLVASDTDGWSFGDGDFTIDFWLWVPAHTGTSMLIINHKSDSNWLGLDFELLGDGSLRFVIPNVSLLDYTSFPVQQWVHVAVTRNGNDWRLFKNGSQVANASSSATYTNPNFQRYIGCSYYGGGAHYLYTGYIDELRVSKGIARWTAPFTPPTAAYGEPEPEPAVIGGRLYLAESGRINIGAGGRIYFK